MWGRPVIAALGLLKATAAEVNAELGELDLDADVATRRGSGAAVHAERLQWAGDRAAVREQTLRRALQRLHQAARVSGNTDSA